MKTLKEQIAELRAVGYKALPAQAKVAHDAVLLAMHRSGFKLKSAIKGGVVMSSITGDIRRATMDMDIDFVHHSISIRSIERFVQCFYFCPDFIIWQLHLLLLPNVPSTRSYIR